MIGVGLLVAAFAAQAQDRPGPGPGPGPGGGPSGPGMMMFGGSPERAARSIDRLLDGLNANEAQRAQIRQIVVAAAGDLRRQHDAERGLRDRGLELFGAPSVDANAAEALRQQMSTQRDQSSRRVLQAMLDVAKVLTPEQRASLARRMRDHEGMMRDRSQRPQPASASQR